MKLISASLGKTLLLPLFLLTTLGLSGCNDDSDSDDPEESADLPGEVIRPLIFVHGTAGSASQYMTQAMRFDSHGYDADNISAFEYSTNGIGPITVAATGGLNAALDAHVDAELARLGAEQVNLACHSLGARVCAQYLSDPMRADKVNGYVALDGGGSTESPPCPGDVPCLGIFVNEAITLGDNNLHLPDETHVQAATSAASFAGQFEFFTGVEPASTDISTEDGTIEVSGRAVYFPANEGADGTSLQVWEIDSATGERQADDPLATFAIAADGSWGPADLQTGEHYEFELLRPGRATHHFYRQPFLRSSGLVRFNTSPAGSAIEINTNSSPDHASLVISRDLEWMVDNGAEIDLLEIATVSGLWPDQPSVNILSAAMGPGNIGIHVHDDAATPAITSGDLLPYFPDQLFQTGVDVYMPATSPPDGHISIVSTQRGDASNLQTLNVPNWASSDHRISLILNDFLQD
ncbi:MAG: alpha/beta fold hydrolase [Halopseudomonas sp.]|uniref:alpha/beta fold hydrolase n=1 Tax=Halopseudomonas sp. TaxID=2901191 RepID=UPI003001F60D